MKNIIKRGTSLLLVLAMLLSFAAVVGAEAPTTTTPESGKILTLTVGNTVLKAGENYIPVYASVLGDSRINNIQITARSSNPAITIDAIYQAIPSEIDSETGMIDFDESTGALCNKKLKGAIIVSGTEARFSWMHEKTGFTAEMVKDLPICYIKATGQSTAAVGAYQISVCPWLESTDKYVYSVWQKDDNSLEYHEDDTVLNPGTAIVLPEGASLPTVILTDDTFAVPTWEQMQAKQDKYPLASLMKIVGNDNKLYDVDPASLDVSATENLPVGVYLTDSEHGKTLELATRAEANTTGISLTVKSAKAVGADISISAPATITAKISKADRGVWKAGFATNDGYYVTDTSFEKSYSAPEYETPEEAYKYLSLNPSAIDYYGKKVENYGVTSAELEIYSDAQHQNRITTADVLESVKFTDENCNSLEYGSLLKQDVWCRVRAVVTVDENTKLYGDWLEFQIVNKYPQAASATVVLGDMNGNEFPSGPVTTIDIPYGPTENKTFSIIVKDFRQADGKTMPEGTAPSATDVTIALDGTYTGVSISNDNKLVIDKTAQAGTVAVRATLNGKTLGTLPLTLQKAASVVTELKLYDSATGKPKDGTKIEIKSGVTNGKATLPGIRANDELVLEFEPVCAIDQYGEIYQVEGKNFLRPSQYALYKQSSTNPETYELCDVAERSVDAEGVVTATIKNSLDNDGTLLVQPGIYKFGTYDDNGLGRFNLNQKLMSDPFELVYGESEYNTLEVTADEKSVKVPYAYGTTEQRTQQYLTLTVNAKDQYGRAIDASKITDLALDTSTVWVGGNAIGGNLPVEKDQHTTTASNVLRLEVLSRAGEDMKTKLTADLGVALTFKVDGTAKRIEKTKVTTLTKDASVLSRVSANIGDFSFSASTLDPSKTEATFNLTAPKDETKTYDVSIYTYDQYASNMSNQYAVTEPEDGSIKLANGKLTVTAAAANKELVISFPNAATPTWKVTIKVVPMEFVKSETGKNDTFQLGDYLTNDTFRAEYNGQPWSTILTTKPNAKVYIKTAEGNNTPIDADDLSLEVTKDGEAVGMDAKANAGTYKVKLVYTDAERQKYTVDEKTFTITPKTVTITANGAITKEYDGTKNLPGDAANKLELNGVVENDGVSIDTSMLEFASANAGENIAIRLKEAGTNCLKTASGELATNYTADPSELKGTITPRKLIVTPKAETFEYGENDKITTALTTEFDYAGKNGDLPSGLTPTFTGSMVLTQNDTKVSSPYNVGDYYPRQGTLGVNSTNYEIEFKTTVNQGNVKWIVSPKTVAKFDCEELNESYGINGGELHTSLANMYVVTNANGSLKISDLYDVAKLTITGVASTGTDPVNAGMYTVSGWDAAKKTNANYSVTSPKVTITVNPHTLTSADIQSTDNWGAKDFTGEELTFTAFKVSFTYNGRPIELVENQDYVIVNNSNKGIYSAVTLRIKAADGSTNYTGEARAPQSWSIRDFKVRTGDLEIYQTNTLTYDGTPKTAEFAVRVISTDSARQKVLGHFTIANNIVDMWGNTATDAGEHTAGGSFVKGFSEADGGVNVFTWKILKSDKSPIQNQTANTKYGQPGSKEISVSAGVAKGLDTSKLSVSIVTDTDNIISGTPSVKFENGKITVNWQLQGDAITIDKSAKLRVTVAETDNYKQYTFDVDVTVTAKTPQTNFGFTTATDATVGYAEDTYTNPVQNAKTTPAYTSSNQNVATVASNGVVTIRDVGTTIITANAPENGEYASATASYTLTVVRSTLTVTASSATMTANDSVPSFTASVTGLKRGQTTAQVFQTLTASTATDGKTAGAYAVNASATLKTDFVPRYTLRFVPGTLTVNPAQTAIDVVLPIIIGGNTCANGYANCACESFYDLDAGRWYHEAIDWAYSLGLMNGTTRSTFGPNAAATRAQTWTMLARIAGQDTRRSSTWYEVGQKWAMNLGITDGTNPMGSLTREQLAAMLYRYVGSPAVNGTLTFTDSANVSTWARNAMIWAVQNGILDGVGGNRLNPKGTTTRAQAAAIFMRFSKLINK